MNIFEEMVKANKSFKAYAVVTVVNSNGIGTADPGKKMIMYADGMIVGTIGGGQFEFECMKIVRGMIAKGKTTEMINFSGVDLLVEVYDAGNTLVVVGGGHVGNCLLKTAKLLPFATILIDDRDEGLITESRELADYYIKCTNYEEAILSSEIPEGAYYFCAAWNHDFDAQGLKGALQKNPKYVGMVGSREKKDILFAMLREQGVSLEQLDSIYTPVGLDIADGSPAEIAFAIMAEILMIKNNGTGENCKGIKTKFLSSNCDSMVEPVGGEK